MTDRRCERCLFNDICSGAAVCDDFYDWTSDESETNRVIEDGRCEYFDEWCVYTEDQYDDIKDERKTPKVLRVII